MDTRVFSAWTQPLIAAAVALVVGIVAQRAARAVLFRLLREQTTLGRVLRHIDRPTQAVLPLLALELAWHGVPESIPGIGATRHLTGVLLILAVTWAAVEAVRGVADAIIAKHPYDVDDNLEARRVLTQTRVLSRTVMSMIAVAGVAFVLMTFPGARQLGASLLASAGIAGLVAGIAAKSVFSNLIAGLQIALTQPLRIDDVLIVEGEWGRVEEITGTYVVLRIWDERRLIIPLGWFIENPFQNWTRSSSQILGTVFLWVDYTLPVEPLRAEARRICEQSPDWDGRVCLIQVTDATERTMQLRVLLSSASSGQNFDLRCLVREKLIDVIAREHPQALPHLRTELREGAPRPKEGAAPPPAPVQSPTP
jgi:small-conductance mechanosensitive channel